MYKVPEAKGSKPEGQFEFQLPGAKKVYRVPKLDYLTADQALVVAKVQNAAEDEFGVEQVEALLSLFESVCDAPVRSFEMSQLAGLFNAWTESSAVGPGESDSSAA